jgi:ribonucleoside-triphosphate reductase (formate)
MTKSTTLPKKRMRFIDRKLDNGMGRAVARRTYLRRISDKETGKERWETWSEVADRVALGNTLLAKNIKGLGKKHQKEEYEILRKHIANASLLMSGRHLQHGDETQPERNMEVFTNCSTASSSYILFYLLMNGSGVGRAYDDDMCVVNWDNMPNVRCVLSEDHKDFVWGFDESVRDAKHKYGEGDNIHWFEVPDSREGWSQAVEMLEVMAFEKKFKDELLILDFSNVRHSGSVIKGMQNRPASGPKPIMNAIERVGTIKGAGMSPWKQALFIDHYLAECVLVGGARRSARIATKNWTDPEVFEFINIKRGGFLWSANNSITVDEKFWKQKTQHSKKVLNAVLQASYHDGTGEPGFVNQHRLVQNDEGYDDYVDGKYAESQKYQPMARTEKMLSLIARNASSKLYSQIPNPCGEISLNMLGGYCVIADVVPYHAPTLDDAEEAFRAATRALIRVNTMDCLYSREVKRTNRIGVGMTGIHEFAWNMFGYAFRDLIDEEKSKDFWLTLSRFKRAVSEEAQGIILN